MFLTPLCSATQPNQESKPTPRHKPVSFAFIPQPGSICHDAAFYAELTCHLQPCLPTYAAILLGVRLNL